MGNLCCVRKRERSPESESTAPASTPSTGNFAQDLLNVQNGYRAKHGAPPMTLNKKLNSDAQKWANHIAKNNVLKHSNDRDGAGENLAWGSRDLSAEEAAKMWYDEIKDYNFKKPGFSGSTGHFTQLVWKSSTEFGGAFAKSSSGGTYVVGRYFSAGNINTADEFRENVLPLQ